jgi:hypothetical protein
MVKQTLSVDDFWATIEEAWSKAPAEAHAARARLLTSDGTARLKASDELDTHFETMFAALRAILTGYTSRQLCVWDAHCERALYDIDREDVHVVLDGSDDGFLYGRGYVVAAGRKYYDAVSKDPGTYAIEDIGCEDMCYFGAHLHQDRFGEWVKRTEISRESCSNAAGWKKVSLGCGGIGWAGLIEQS